VQRPGLIGFLLLALAVALLIVVPMDSAWKWPTVMVLLIVGFVMLFISAAQRPTIKGRSKMDANAGTGDASGDVDGGRHKPDNHSHDGGSDGGSDGGGGGGD